MEAKILGLRNRLKLTSSKPHITYNEYKLRILTLAREKIRERFILNNEEEIENIRQHRCGTCGYHEEICKCAEKENI